LGIILYDSTSFEINSNAKKVHAFIIAIFCSMIKGFNVSFLNSSQFTILARLMAANVPLLCDVAFKAERVFSAKIEFNRENGAEDTENQQ